MGGADGKTLGFQQSWRTFFRNQTMAFSDNQYSEQQPGTEYPYNHAWSY